MAQNVLIAGALFSNVPSISVPDQNNNWHSYVDTSDADATANDMLNGKTAYVNGAKLTGTYVPQTCVLQSKTVSPSTSQQTVSPDSGYDGLSQVTVNAMPSGTATTPATTITANPTISVSSGGLITASVSGLQSVTPTVSAGYVSSGTAGTVTVSGSNTQQLTVQAAQTIHPSTTDQTIVSGKYLTGAQTVKGVLLTNLSASNIKKDVVVKVGDSTDDDCVTSVTGTYEGGGGGGTSSYNKIYDTEITVSYSSTSSSKVADISVGSSLFTKDKLLYIRIRDKAGKRNGYFYGTDNFCSEASYANNGTPTNMGSSSILFCYNYTNNQWTMSTSRYGIYVASIRSNGVLRLYATYSSAYSGTIDGTYKVEVYTLDWPDNVSPYNA